MRFAAFLVVLLVLGGAAIGAMLHSFNYFGEVKRQFAGQCQPVAGIAGPEDIQIDSARRIAFISSLDRRGNAPRGGIHVFDLDNPLGAGGWRDMTKGVPDQFRPLGLDYYEDGDVRRLFVVNEANLSVELFDVGGDGALTHIETFSERRMTSPNNVAAVGRRSFYVTNDVKPGRNTQMGNLHFLIKAKSGEVLFTDGNTWRVAVGGLRFANGIAVSADSAKIYVAETAGKALKVYERNPVSGALTAEKTISLPAAPDNLSIDEDGAIWIAALPKPLTVPAHSANPKKPAPSEVIKVTADGAVETIYRDDGGELSASTAAARLGGKLMIGALYGDKFLLCDLPASKI